MIRYNFVYFWIAVAFLVATFCIFAFKTFVYTPYRHRIHLCKTIPIYSNMVDFSTTHFRHARGRGNKAAMEQWRDLSAEWLKGQRHLETKLVENLNSSNGKIGSLLWGEGCP